jgi:hypothetical protein
LGPPDLEAVFFAACAAAVVLDIATAARASEEIQRRSVIV